MSETIPEAIDETETVPGEDVVADVADDAGVDEAGDEAGDEPQVDDEGHAE